MSFFFYALTGISFIIAIKKHQKYAKMIKTVAKPDCLLVQYSFKRNYSLMFKNAKNEYSVQVAPTDDTEVLEALLNQMSSEGWELYTLHEAESKSGGSQYNCIFYRENEESDEDNKEMVDISDFKSKMEKMLHPSSEPFEQCKELQRKIKEKQDRVTKVKSLLDSSSDDINRKKLNDEMSKCLTDLKDLKNQLSESMSPDKMYEKIKTDKLSIVISDELLDMVNPDKEAQLVAETVRVRQELTNKLGYVIPAIRFTDSETLESNEYSINVRGIPTLTGRVFPGYRMFYLNQVNFERKPKGAIEDVDSIRGEAVIWIEESKTKDFWEKGLTPEGVIAKNLEHIAVKYVDEILDYNDVNRYIEIAGSQNLLLIEGIIPEFLSIGDLRYIFAALIRERVPLNDIVYIFERLNDMAQEQEKDNILEELRISLNRHISKSIADKNRVIYGISFSDKIIQSFEKELLKDEENIAIKTSLIKKLAKQLNEILKDSEADINNIAVIAPSSLRQILFIIFEQVIPGLSVLAREEVSKEYKLEIIGTIE